jgi:hypothetical protein
LYFVFKDVPGKKWQIRGINDSCVLIQAACYVFTGFYLKTSNVKYSFAEKDKFFVNEFIRGLQQKGIIKDTATEQASGGKTSQQADYSQLTSLSETEKINRIKDKYRELFGNSNMGKCCYFADSLAPKTSKNVYENLHIPKDESVFLFFDDTMFHSGKVGFAFTPEGVYAKMSNPFDRNAPTHSIWDIPWKDMPDTFHLSLGGHPILGTKSVMLAFTDAGKDIAQSSAVFGSTTADVQNNFEKIAELIVFMCILFTGREIGIIDER